MGRRGAIGADCLREGQVVVDVGIHVNEEGKLCGDVRFDEAEPIVEAVSYTHLQALGVDSQAVGGNGHGTQAGHDAH